MQNKTFLFKNKPILINKNDDKKNKRLVCGAGT